MAVFKVRLAGRESVKSDFYRPRMFFSSPNQPSQNAEEQSTDSSRCPGRIHSSVLRQHRSIVSK